MPGIFGIISKRPTDMNVEELNIMCKSANMEQFYNSGKFVHVDMGVYIGWTCHKGSFADCLPIINEKEDKFLIYFGENFNDQEDMDELKRHNHKYDKNNASYLIHMYEEWEDKFLVKLNGWFHGILIDIEKKKIILFNDRYGMQRIYYVETNDAFYFSAEAKTILKILPQVRQIELISLAEFFACNCVFDNRSLFKKIYILPGGACWTFFRDGEVEKEAYFEPSVLENQPLLEREFHYERLRNTFHNILKRYFRSEDPIGMFLTGGIDCRILLSNAQYGPGKLPCYTSSYIYGNTYDVNVVQRLADAISQPLHVINFDDNIFLQYNELLEKTVYISEGNCDASGTIELYLNQIAREIAPIQISHNFGGTFLRKEEIVRLNNLNSSLFSNEFQNLFHEVLKKYRNLSSMSLTDNINKGLPWSAFGYLSILQSQLTVRSPFTDNDFVELLYRVFDEVISSDKMSLRLIKDGNPLLSEIELHREVKNCKSLFNCSMQNWTSKINEYILNIRNMGRERVFLENNKLNHFRVWYRNKLSNYLKEILLDKRSTNRSYIDENSLVHIVNSHINGTRNYTSEINKILTAEFVHRFFIDG